MVGVRWVHVSITLPRHALFNIIRLDFPIYLFFGQLDLLYILYMI